eukprot:COSAG04_NODE_973_length_9084_cov_7.608792_3_plen_124_part_00
MDPDGRQHAVSRSCRALFTRDRPVSPPAASPTAGRLRWLRSDAATMRLLHSSSRYRYCNGPLLCNVTGAHRVAASGEEIWLPDASERHDKTSSKYGTLVQEVRKLYDRSSYSNNSVKNPRKKK